MKKNLIIFLIATFFGSGMSPKAPGTMGSLAALPCAALIHFTLGMEALCVATVIVFFGGWWITGLYMVMSGKSVDPQEVVIDEVAGQWLTLCLMPLLYMNPPMEMIPWLYAAAFVSFRLFDIWKPWPISVADRKIKSAFGVMFDDILAAIFAVLLIGALGHLATGLGIITIAVGHP
jgi:phosphatidylglycerophosphatase A